MDFESNQVINDQVNRSITGWLTGATGVTDGNAVGDDQVALNWHWNVELIVKEVTEKCQKNPKKSVEEQRRSNQRILTQPILNQAPFYWKFNRSKTNQTSNIFQLEKFHWKWMAMGTKVPPSPHPPPPPPPPPSPPPPTSEHFNKKKKNSKYTAKYW